MNSKRIPSYMLTRDWEDQLDCADNTGRRFLDLQQIKEKVKTKWVTYLTLCIIVGSLIGMVISHCHSH